METSTNITAKLVAWSKGDGAAMDELYPLVDRELRRLARNYIRNLQPGNIFQTTALINEAYIRLADQQKVKWQNRDHFFAISAKMMRRILLNHLRDAKRKKRGAGAIHISLSGVAVVAAQRSSELLNLDEALSRLEKLDHRKAAVVEMRFFGGMTTESMAEVLGISKVTVMRDWRVAKAWLAREMQNEQS